MCEVNGISNKTYEHYTQLIEAKVPLKVRTRIFELEEEGHTPRCSMSMADPMFHACECDFFTKTKAGLGTYNTRNPSLNKSGKK